MLHEALLTESVTPHFVFGSRRTEPATPRIAFGDSCAFSKNSSACALAMVTAR